MGKKWLGRVQAGLYGVVNGRFCIALLLEFVMECIMVLSYAICMQTCLL